MLGSVMDDSGMPFSSTMDFMEASSKVAFILFERHECGCLEYCDIM